MLLLLLLPLHMVLANSDIRICDTTDTALATPPPAYTDYIRSLYRLGLSTESLIMPDNCNQYATLDTVANAISGAFGIQGNADAGGNHAHCESVYNNIQNAFKGVGLTVNWPSDLPSKYQDYTDLTPPAYTSQVINLMSTPSIQHDFVAKTLRTTVWTSVYLQRPSQYDGQVHAINNNEVALCLEAY